MSFKQTAYTLGLLFFCTGSASADIVLQVSDNGTDLTLQWTGTMDLGSTTSNAVALDIDAISATSTAFLSLDGSSRSHAPAGTLSGNDPWIGSAINTLPSNGSGSGFGFTSNIIVWDDSFGVSPGVIAPDRTWTVAGLTVADAFGTNLNSGPVLLWTHNTSGDTISVAGTATTAVPEPGSFAVLGIAGIGLALGHRRRR